jgi:ATP-dependent DNA helicase RecQ
MLTIRRFKGSAKKLSSALRQYRKREAIKDHIEPYAVFSNRTLVELVEKVPLTLEELKKIYGIGPHKLDKYGESLLEIIKRVNEKEKMRIITAPLSKKTVK